MITKIVDECLQSVRNYDKVMVITIFSVCKNLKSLFNLA